jgi:hypothetical protein
MIVPVENHAAVCRVRMMFVILLAIVFVSPPSVHAQEKVISALIKPDTTNDITDSLGIRAGRVEVSLERHAKSGSLAMLLSAVVPGAGQIYAHRYYTIPIIWGFTAYFTSLAISSEHDYQNYRAKFAASVRLDTAAHAGDPDFLRIRDFYHNQRDEFIFYFAITYILNIVDAYVGATLYDFDVSDQLGGSAAIRFRIPLR